MSIFSKLRAAAEVSRKANAAVMSEYWDGGREERAEKVAQVGAILSAGGVTAFMLSAISNQAAEYGANFPGEAFANDTTSQVFMRLHDAFSTLGTITFHDGSSMLNASLIGAGAAISGLVVMVARNAPIFQKNLEKVGISDWVKGAKNLLSDGLKQSFGVSDAKPAEKMSNGQSDLKALAIQSVKDAYANAAAMGVDLDDLDGEIRRDSHRQRG
jgi:hypothetical protein